MRTAEEMPSFYSLDNHTEYEMNPFYSWYGIVQDELVRIVVQRSELTFKWGCRITQMKRGVDGSKKLYVRSRFDTPQEAYDRALAKAERHGGLPSMKGFLPF